MHVDLVYNRTGYDVTSYFRSAIIEVRKRVEMQPSTAFGRILVARHFAWYNQLVGFLLTSNMLEIY